MADYTNKVANPWVLHLQKLGLELKCPLCLKLLARPVLLPCDHIICDSCTPRSSQVDSDCPLCKSKYANQDLRDLRFIENVISIYRSLDATFRANMLQLRSANDNICNNGGKSGELEVVDKSVVRRSGTHSRQFPQPSSEEIDFKPNLQNRLPELNQAEQRLLDSPPSFGDAKCSDNDTSDYSLGSYTGHVAKRILNISAPEATGDYLKDSKRQKKLIYGTADVGLHSDVNLKSIGQPIEASMTYALVPEQRSEVVHLSLNRPAISDDPSVNITICAFCQSSRISDASGEMLHYSKGRQVEGHDIFRSNVIHVHRACVEWAPQVYFEGDSVKNLKAELARGMKIKCTKCGMRGAALGCYVKSCRRSFHVPCAREIPKCRWDNNDFVMLCSAHSSVKFPSEKSRARVLEAQPRSVQPTMELVSPMNQLTASKELVLCGSALSLDERRLLEKLAGKIGAVISRYWKPNVTHVIAATDGKGACVRTLKVLMGILNGKWILNIDWIKASFEASRPVDEEAYEISLDTQGCNDGPKTARLSVADNAPKLFAGFKFYFFGDFVRGYKEDLQSLIKVAGGRILNSEDEVAVESYGDKQASSRKLVVYNIDPPPGCVLGEGVSIIWQRANEAEELSSKTGSLLVGHTWILESIAAYKLQPLIS